MPQLTTNTVIDVTDTSEVAFLTGVQRVVRGLARGAQDLVLLVRFDSRADEYRVIDAIPPLEKRESRGIAHLIRKGLRKAFEIFAFQVRVSHAADYLLPRIYYRIAWSFYVKHLGDARLRDNPKWRKSPIWKPQPASHFVLAEIPRDPRQIERIRRLQIRDSVKTTVYLHDLIPLTSADLLPAGSRAAIRGEFLSYMDVVTGADEVISNSQSTLDDYQKYLTLVSSKPEQARRVLYPASETAISEWIESANSGPIPGISMEIPGVEDSAKKILFIGSMGARKNLEVVLRATFNLVAEGFRVQLIIVTGQGRERTHEVDQLLRRSTRKQQAAVIFLENLSDEELRTVYQSCSLVVVPSLAEGFGLPIIEAIQSGKPVISSKIPVFVELSELLGFPTVAPHDVLGWQDAIIEAFQAKGGLPKPDLRCLAQDWSHFAERLLIEDSQIHERAGETTDAPR